MAEKNSQPHNNATWKRMVDENTGRIESFYAEMAKVEDKGVHQMNAAIDESARLMKDSFAWYAELSAEWRKMALDATRRSAELFAR
jgi:hypothetical protein